jgi:threonine dehydratase
MIELARIKKAAEDLRGRTHRTPLLSSRTLGERVDVELYLKCECFQKTGSFKPRGALNKILSLSANERQRGIITVSAGNHAQAVAWASQAVGASAAVVMPSDAPQSKIDAVRGYDGEAILHNDRTRLFDRLNAERESRGAFFIHPFDDETVVAGAGTAGLEIIEDLPEVDTVVVPVGGGGLLSGVTSAVKQLRPQTRVIAVELEAGPGLGPALEAGEPVTVSRPADTLADGMTPPFVGKLALEITREAVDHVVTVTEEEIIDAMMLLMTRAKLFVEGSGAAATAAVLSRKVGAAPGERVVAIVSGGNVDMQQIVAMATERGASK